MAGIDKNTLLLLHGDSLKDTSEYNVPITNNGVIISTKPSKFSEKTLYFNRSSMISNNFSLDFNKPFTIDFWIYLPQIPQDQSIFRVGFGQLNSIILYYINDKLTLYGMGHNGTILDNVITINNWYHIAVVHDGTKKLKFFKNGILQTTVNMTIDLGTGTKMILGASGVDTTNIIQYFTGYIDEFRISNIARWTSNFTPPTEPYTESIIPTLSPNSNIVFNNKDFSEIFFRDDTTLHEVFEVYFNSTLLWKKSSIPTIPTYTGRYALFGDANKGYMELLTDGILTFPTAKTIDIFLVGGGRQGVEGYKSRQYPDLELSGNGGSGGETQSYFKLSVPKNSECSTTIGKGGYIYYTKTSGSEATIRKYDIKYSEPTDTTFILSSIIYKASKGSGAYNKPSDTGTGSGGGQGLVYKSTNEHNGGCNGGTDGNNGEYQNLNEGFKGLGVIGQHRTTRAFNGDVEPFKSQMPPFAGGGGGAGSPTRGHGGKGFDGGGGGGWYTGCRYNIGGTFKNANVSKDWGQMYDGYDALANTGSGGGGASFGEPDYYYLGGAGGSGIVIIRWGY